MLLSEQIGSWSTPPSGPCWKWRLHMARLWWVGLVGPLVSDNAEWSSVLLGHAGIENRICGIIRLRARGVSGRVGIDLEGLKARGSRQQYFFCHHSSHLFHQSFRFEGGGVSGNAWRTHPSRTTLKGRGSGDAAPLREVRGRGMSATTVYH